MRFATSLKIAAVFVAIYAARFANVAMASDQVPGGRPAGPVLLTGGDIYTVSGDVLKGGWLLIADGKIRSIGQGEPPAQGDHSQTIDCRGKRVYPGMLAVGNELGLTEVSAVRATRDASETGQLNPNIRAEVGINSDSELIPVTRSNGVLLNLTVPSGGLVTGTSALIQLDGWTWEQMTLKAPVGLHVRWPRLTPTKRGDEDDATNKTPSRSEDELRLLQKLFDDARAYAAGRSAEAATRPSAEKAPGSATPGDRTAEGSSIGGYDARLEAMRPVVAGKLPVIAWADEIRQIESAVAFCAKEKVSLIIVGGYDADRCAPLLKQNKVAVVVEGTQRLPQRRDAGVDDAYTLPERLRKAGVTYCISFSGRFASNLRNLPYHAAGAVACGLDADEALRAITLYPAQILGVADRVGSLEPGKDATLFVADGDILETASHVTHAFIQGRPVDLTNKQTELWEKYKKKYEQLDAAK